MNTRRGSSASDAPGAGAGHSSAAAARRAMADRRRAAASAKRARAIALYLLTDSTLSEQRAAPAPAHRGEHADDEKNNILSLAYVSPVIPGRPSGFQAGTHGAARFQIRLTGFRRPSYNGAPAIASPGLQKLYEPDYLAPPRTSPTSVPPSRRAVYYTPRPRACASTRSPPPDASALLRKIKPQKTLTWRRQRITPPASVCNSCA